MLQEREEKISSLQKSIQVQNDHVHKLTSKVEVMERRSKQTVQRFDLKLENAAHEKEMLKTQLKVLYEEMKKMSEDPIHQALRNNNRNSSANSNGSSSTNTASTVHSGRSEEEEILSQIMPAGNPFDENSSSSNISGNSNNNNSTGSNSAHSRNSRNSTVRVDGNSDADEKIKLANSAQAILLQSQLYQALTSLKQLRQQTRGMKANYDAVVSSLQHDLVQCMDDKVRSETGLLSQLQSLEHSSRVREEGLREEMKNKDTRIERLMRRIGVLDKIDDDGSLSYMSDDVSVMGGDGDRDGDGNGNGKADAEETVDIDCGDTTSAVLDHFTTPAGVGSRSLSSRISDLHSPTSVTANLWKDAELKSPVSFRNQHQDHNPIFKEYSDSFTKRARASATRIMAASASVSASASAPKNEAAPRLISQNETRNNARAILERSQSRAKMILEKTASTLSSKPIFTPTPTPISVNEVESALAELEAVTEAEVEVDFGAEESTEGDELGLMLDGEGSESADVELEMESESEFNVSAKDEIRAEGRLRQADAFKGRSGSHDDDGDPDLR